VYLKDKQGREKRKSLTREEIDGRFKSYSYPISLSAWDSYKKSLSETAETGAADMKLESLFKICAYTGVSADYLLGFIDTKHKEQSAEMVREEFGLSDETMKALKGMVKRKKTREVRWYHYETRFNKIDFVNFLLEHLSEELVKYIDKYLRDSNELDNYMNPEWLEKEFTDKNAQWKEKFGKEVDKDDWEDQAQRAILRIKEDINLATYGVTQIVNDLLIEFRQSLLDQPHN